MCTRVFFTALCAIQTDGDADDGDENLAPLLLQISEEDYLQHLRRFQHCTLMAVANFDMVGYGWLALYEHVR